MSAHNQKSLNVAVITLEKTVEVNDEPIDCNALLFLGEYNLNTLASMIKLGGMVILYR